MDTGIRVGTEVSKQSIQNLSQGICAILKMQGDQKTIRKALDVFRHSVQVQNVTISNVTLNGDKTINVD